MNEDCKVGSNRPSMKIVYIVTNFEDELSLAMILSYRMPKLLFMITGLEKPVQVFVKKLEVKG